MHQHLFFFSNFFLHVKISLGAEGEWSKTAPLRVLSFDIECAARKGHFPSPQHDPIIQIANIVKVQGKDNKIIARNVFNLNSCASIAGAHVLTFDTEKQVKMVI